MIRIYYKLLQIFILISYTIAQIEINTFQVPRCFKELQKCEYEIGHKAMNFYKNKKVLFVGDSLTRYQYLSLAYILRHRQAQKKLTYPSIVQENSWGGNWDQFFLGSTNLLHPYENCTVCDRNGFFEYRQYNDIINNIQLTYIQFRGIGFEKDVFLQTYFPNNQHLDLVITNVGFFGFHFSVQPESYLNVMKNLATKVVWKTTTYQDGELADPEWWIKHNTAPVNRTIMNAMDYRMCNYLDIICLDLSWTAKHVVQTDYWDTTHFTEPIYLAFNDEMINKLSSN